MLTKGISGFEKLVPFTRKVKVEFTDERAASSILLFTGVEISLLGISKLKE